MSPKDTLYWVCTYPKRRSWLRNGSLVFNVTENTMNVGHNLQFTFPGCLFQFRATFKVLQETFTRICDHMLGVSTHANKQTDEHTCKAGWTTPEKNLRLHACLIPWLICTDVKAISRWDEAGSLARLMAVNYPALGKGNERWDAGEKFVLLWTRTQLNVHRSVYHKRSYLARRRAIKHLRWCCSNCNVS